MSHIPAYKEVYSKLKEELKEGIYPAGSLLPTESELEKIFHVSRTTIRKAISILSLEGYVKTKQGYGTEVLNIFTVQKLNQITSITETLRQKGYTVKTKSMYIEKITAPESIMSIMEMHTPAPIYKVQRVQTADGVPIALMTNYVKCSYTPGLEHYIDGFTSFYSFLEKKYNRNIEKKRITRKYLFVNLTVDKSLFCSEKRYQCKPPNGGDGSKRQESGV